ncbi:MAG: hypothetical protein EHM47_15790, partial [Ignavibacteriales bacterium]
MLHPGLFKIFVLSFLFIQISNGQIIESSRVSGNSVFSDNQYRDWSGILINSQLTPGILDSIKNRTARQLSLRGYFNFEISFDSLIYSPNSQKVSIVYNIVEGTPTYISEIKIEGRDSIDKRYSDLFEFQEGEIFNKYELEDNISETLTWLEDNGYPFAKVVVTSVQLKKVEDENLADVNLNIETGNRSTIDKIEITGNTSTKDYVITRELRIDSGSVYSQKLINELPSRLNRLRFFDPIGAPQFYFDSDDNGILVINVKERETNNFDGIIGYIPPVDENEKGYVTGLVNISLRNLFGTGRAAAIRWQQYDRNSQELELKYLEPWLFDYPFNISLGLYQRKQDTSYVHRRFDGSLEFLATEDISASLILGTEQIIPTITETNIFKVYNSNIITTGVNLKIDTRDDPYAPTSGLFFLNSYSFSRKTINGPVQFITPGLQTKINLQRFELDLSYFLELFSRQVVAAGVHGRELRGSFFENSDLFRLGGTNSLRGYR